MSYNEDRRFGWQVAFFVTVIVTILFLLLVSWTWISPRYNLYRASIEKRILVEEAKAQKDSATELAQAEVERAKGVAEANEIIAQSIDEQYLRYLFITTALNTDDKTVIYVPTEAGLPILEAERLPEEAP